MTLPEASQLDVAEIKREAMNLVRNRVRGQHSNNKVIRLCIEIENLRSERDRLIALLPTPADASTEGK